MHREDSDPRYITKSADVKLRSFTTKVRARTGTSSCQGLCS